MGFWVGMKRRLRAGVAPAVFLSLVGYFSWNATQGERGLQSYAMRQEQLKSVQAELARVQTGDKENLGAPGRRFAHPAPGS